MASWTPFSSASSDMKPALIASLAATLLFSACGAHGKDPERCSIVRASDKGAQVLDAIADGGIAWLVGCGLKPNQGISVQGQLVTPLQFAASVGRAALVRQVVAAGADPNFVGTAEGALPPLETALSSQKYEAAQALLDLGSRADYELARTRTTALMTLAFDESSSGAAAGMGKTLVSKGASVHARDAKGNTALHWSARSNNGRVATALLDLGADACVTNDKGQRPSDLVPQEAAALQSTLAAACKKPR